MHERPLSDERHIFQNDDSTFRGKIWLTKRIIHSQKLAFSCLLTLMSLFQDGLLSKNLVISYDVSEAFITSDLCSSSSCSHHPSQFLHWEISKVPMETRYLVSSKLLTHQRDSKFREINLGEGQKLPIIILRGSRHKWESTSTCPLTQLSESLKDILCLQCQVLQAWPFILLEVGLYLTLSLCTKCGLIYWQNYKFIVAC